MWASRYNCIDFPSVLYLPVNTGEITMFGFSKDTFLILGVVFSIAYLFNGSFNNLSAQLLAMDTRLHQADKDLEEKMETKFDQVNAKFDQVNRKFDQVNAKFDQVNRRIGDLNTRMSALESRMSAIEATVSTALQLRIAKDTGTGPQGDSVAHITESGQ
jgi:peptidoglycan hydrolase CwlO-like protein